MPDKNYYRKNHEIIKQLEYLSELVKLNQKELLGMPEIFILLNEW